MRTALITGGSRGIGRATVEKFLEKGFKVISTSTSGKFDYGHEHLIVRKLNIGINYDVVNFATWIENENTKVHVLINNAGVAVDKEESIVNIAKLRETLNVNLLGTIQLTEELLLRNTLEKDSVIVNLSSRFGSLNEEVGNIWPSYRISKASLNMYTVVLADRLKADKISVYSFDPGWVKTDMGGEGAIRDASDPANEIYDLAHSDNKSGIFYDGEGAKNW